MVLLAFFHNLGTGIIIIFGLYILFILAMILNIIITGSKKEPEPKPYVREPSITRKWMESTTVYLKKNEGIVRIDIPSGSECDYCCESLSLSGLEGFKCNDHLEVLCSYPINRTIKDSSYFHLSYYNIEVAIYCRFYRWVYE